jgi:hypothetical protein
LVLGRAECERVKHAYWRALDDAINRRRWRSTNLLERSLGEVKRRTR